MSKLTSNLSSAALKKAATLQSRIEQLQADLAKLLRNGKAAAPVRPKRGRRTMSAAQRKRMSAVAKARWKKAKAAGKSRL